MCGARNVCLLPNIHHLLLLPPVYGFIKLYFSPWLSVALHRVNFFRQRRSLLCPLMCRVRVRSPHEYEYTRFQIAFARRSYLFEKQFHQINPIYFCANCKVHRALRLTYTQIHTSARFHSESKRASE